MAGVPYRHQYWIPAFAGMTNGAAPGKDLRPLQPRVRNGKLNTDAEHRVPTRSAGFHGTTLGHQRQRIYASCHWQLDRTTDTM